MKVYNRTENSLTVQVSVREALAEVNTAMMEGRRQVKTMSSGRGHHIIEYKDGRTVRLIETDAEEAQEWGEAATASLLHKFSGDGPADKSADYRAKCRKSIRWYPRPLSQTEGPRLRTRAEIESAQYAHLYRFCPRCEAKA
ncbi:hypothetical protein [Streptomyces sp. 135]|uniref:hypothetical protein n=1 Tax=Streptomyces sp. 135 TaxID=2838850 RepID=UPI001CC15772|nr:hypothetical protein [Streptomyces sp. 135]